MVETMRQPECALSRSLMAGRGPRGSGDQAKWGVRDSAERTDSSQNSGCSSLLIPYNKVRLLLGKLPSFFKRPDHGWLGRHLLGFQAVDIQLGRLGEVFKSIQET